MKRESAAECPNPDYVALLLIFYDTKYIIITYICKKRFMYLRTESCFFYGFHEIR